MALPTREPTLAEGLEPDFEAFAFPSSASYARAERRRYAAHVGTMLALLAAMLFLYIEAVDQSPVLPDASAWAALAPALQVDILFALAAIGAVAVLPFWNPQLARTLTIQPGGIANGLFIFPLFWLVGLALAGALLAANGQATHGNLDDATKLLGILQNVVFVAAGEEMFFRVIPDATVRNKIGAAALSAFGFGLYHIWAYAPANFVVGTVLGQLGLAVVLGFALFAVYKLWGIGASIGLHSGYNIGVSGIAALGVTLSVAGIHFVPI